MLHLTALLARRARHTALLVLSTALLASSVAAGPARADDAPKTISAANLSVLMGGAVAPDYLVDGVYSPDRSRILYRDRHNDGPEAAYAFDYGAPDFWTVRADGTQRTRLTSVNAYDIQTASLEAAWIDDDTVSIRSYDPTEHFGGSLYWLRVAVASGVDTWSTVPADETGELIADGRYRLLAKFDASWTGRVREVVDQDTGEHFVVSTTIYQNVPKPTTWNYDCDDPVRNPSHTLDAALSGPNPACTFARKPRPISPQRLSALLGGTPAAANLSSGTFSPDGSRILFRTVDHPNDPNVRSLPSAHTGLPIWTVRTDGTQPTELLLGDDSGIAFTSATWVDDHTVEIDRQTIQHPGWWTRWERVTTSPAGDTWSTVPDDERGPLIDGGRYRLLVRYDHVLMYEDISVVDQSTGVRYSISSQYGGAPSPVRWSSECGDPVRNPDQTAEGAVSGPHPACTFARMAGDVDPTPAPTQTPTPSVAPQPTATPTATAGEGANVPTPTAAPSATPAPVPTRTPAPSAPFAQPVAVGPSLAVLAIGTRLSSGSHPRLTVKFHVGAAKTIRAWLLAPGGATLSRLSTTGATGDGSVRLPIGPSALKKLRSLGSTGYKVRLSATDAAGHTTVAEHAAVIAR